jgi:transcriptional regulator with XRE-family HTH domain
MTTTTISKPKVPRDDEVSGNTTAHRKPRRVDIPGSMDDIDLRTLGGRISWARVREDMTQEDVAKAINKSRATIVQYENNKINPPVAMVVELSKALNVSPSFVAFGEHGTKASINAEEEVVSIEEITFGRDGSYMSGGFALPRKLAESYVHNPRTLKVYVLNHNAPAFDLRSGDRIFADTSVTVLTSDHDMYLLRMPSGGMEVVRYEPSFEKSATVSFIGPKGAAISVKVKGLDIIGAVVGTLHQH